MTGCVTWLAMAAAIVLVPLGDPVAERVRVLSLQGRLRVLRSHRAPRRAVVRAVRFGSPPLAFAAVGAPVSLRDGPVLGLCAGVVAAAAVRAAAEVARRRSERRARDHVTTAIRLMLAELEAGTDLPAAVGAAAGATPVHADRLREAAAALRAGDSAFGVLAAEPTLAPVGHAFRVAAVSGTPVAGVLSRVVADLDAARDRADAVTTALAGPRSSAGVLAVLPLLGIVLGLSLDADPLRFLFGTAGGQVVCLAGVLLDLAGVAWTRQLAAGAEAAT